MVDGRESEERQASVEPVPKAIERKRAESEQPELELPTRQQTIQEPQVSAATSAIARSHGFDPSIVDTRPVAHKYMFRRPRALQYTYKHETHYLGNEHGILPGGRVPTMFDDGFDPIAYDVEGVTKHREKLDLFIDLIWVGIVTNLSDVFAKIYYESNSSTGEAFALFVIPFLASYRIWNILRSFLDSYYMDDTLQRLFIFWMLLLAIFFGNNLVYLADVADTERFASAKTICITVYLVYRGSFVTMEAIYSHWIPWLRRLTLISWFVHIPSTALWIAALFIDGVNALGPIIAALVWEYTVPLILEFDWAQRFVPGDYHKTFRPEILRSRMSSFFILSVGEGILLLLKGGPLKMGINPTTGLVTWSLLVYLLLVFIYFNKDSSKRSVSAINLKGWRLMGNMLTHVLIFSSLVVMSSGVVQFISENAPVYPSDSSASAHLVTAAASSAPASSDSDSENAVDKTQRAVWSVAVCLAILIVSMWIQALLDRSLDAPGTLLIGNRHVRLAMRPVYAIIVVTIPIAGLTGWQFLGISSLLLLAVSLYEMIACLETPAKLMEPKGLTVIMRRVSENNTTEKVDV